jgi:hypothetical protein
MRRCWSSKLSAKNQKLKVVGVDCPVKSAARISSKYLTG